MPRPRAFDTDKALDAAMQAFWSNGYAATSLDDLTAAMGIGRASLYGAFGCKRALFGKVFQRYDAARRDAMAQDSPPLSAIRDWFRRLLRSAAQADGHRGCLIVNTALELECHDAAMRAQVSGALADIEGFFADRLGQAAQSGALAPSLDHAAIAQAMLGAVLGIRVLSRAAPAPARLRHIANAALALAGIAPLNEPV